MRSMNEFRKVYVAGIGIVRFMRYEEQEWYDFGSQAILNVLKDADMEWKNIQAAFCGSVYQGTGSGHQTIREIGLTGIPIVNVENACSSAASAFRLAYQSVAAEIYDVVLAVGFEKTPQGLLPSTAFRPWELLLGFNIQPANYANEVVRYMKDFGATEEDLARVTVLERKHANINPNAFFYQKGEVTVEDVLNSRMIAKPIRLLNAAAMADGAVAIIVCNEDKLKSNISMKKKVEVAASVLTSGVYGEKMTLSATGPSVKFPASENLTQLCARQAWEISGYGPEDMEVVQAYDAMAPGLLWDLEELGFCKPGEATCLLRDGAFDIGGKLPVNTDGGLMGCAHPLGATAGRQIYEIVLQLRGDAGPRQVEGARIGLAHAMGAGPNSAVTILKR